MAQYGWALWLAGPAAGTLLAAAWAWWRGRPAKVPEPKRAMAEHRAYLEALCRPVEVVGADEQPDPRAAAPARRSPSVTASARSTVSR
jgi:hypothetical protein